MENNPTTIKPVKFITGDYCYRGIFISHPRHEGKWSVDRRGNNGHIIYTRFKTLKAACAYIDNNYDLFQNDVQTMNATPQNKTYVIYCYEAKAATYDENDGFGDYKNYGTRRVCEVGATSEEHALQVAGLRDTYDRIFWASEAK
jgi:hypothetical protein